jgi:peptidoglycan-associated lipoprotein
MARVLLAAWQPGTFVFQLLALTTEDQTDGVEGKCKATASKAECESDAQCGPGQTCSQGRCVTRTDPARAAAEAVARCLGHGSAVSFTFDGHQLDSQGRATLTELATCLKGAGGPARLVVEGHCDERGTSEYNIQLGARRAEAVRTYLTDLGVDAANLRATSYGKERPACTAHDEACWAKNRRGVVVPDAGTPSAR